MKLKPIIISAILAASLSLSGCGWNGTYRYPCQDPKNWELAECKPPLCVPDGWCSKDLIGIDLSTLDPVTGEPLEETTPTTEETPVDPTDGATNE
jgi:hypothetical protein